MESDDQPYIIEFGMIGDASTGYLSVAEHPAVPFKIERMHWTYFTPPDVIRGNHAHKNLKQIILAVAGKIRVETETKTRVSQSFTLTSPHQGLYLPALCWRRIHFNEGAVMVCLASHSFDENDYIRNYQEFDRHIRVL